MADSNLASRIDAQFLAVAEKVKQFQVEQLEAHKGREKRLEKLGQIFEDLRKIWGPKLEILVAKLGELVKVTPRIVPSSREATFDFKSSIAHVRMKLSAYTGNIRRAAGQYSQTLQGQLQLRPDSCKDFQQEGVVPAAQLTLADDAVLARVLLQ